MLESGEFSTIAELVEREAIAPSQINSVIRMKQFARYSVESILSGNQGPEVTLVSVLERFPTEWKDQLMHFKLWVHRT